MQAEHICYVNYMEAEQHGTCCAIRSVIHETYADEAVMHVRVCYDCVEISTECTAF